MVWTFSLFYQVDLSFLYQDVVTDCVLVLQFTSYAMQNDTTSDPIPNRTT